jgi:hypothetical protein
MIEKTPGKRQSECLKRASLGGLCFWDRIRTRQTMRRSVRGLGAVAAYEWYSAASCWVGEARPGGGPGGSRGGSGWLRRHASYTVDGASKNACYI